MSTYMPAEQQDTDVISQQKFPSGDNSECLGEAIYHRFLQRGQSCENVG